MANFHDSSQTGGGGIANLFADSSPMLSNHLDTNNKDIKNNNLLETNVLDIQNGLVEALHPGSGNFQNMVQSDGTFFNETILGHTTLNNQYFFPNGQQILYYKSLPLINNVVVAKCRDGAGQPRCLLVLV